MKINLIATFLLASTLLCYNCSNNIVDKQGDPNIVIVLLDDMGYGDIESFNIIVGCDLVRCSDHFTGVR